MGLEARLLDVTSLDAITDACGSCSPSMAGSEYCDSGRVDADALRRMGEDGVLMERAGITVAEQSSSSSSFAPM